ncbi:MAG TPA: glycosyltransferase, partial [Candidatus Limnocylindrales bacterium]|nr:glycosyltransferase [Candidatus Limnocylindrales bacterium]
DIDAAGQQAIDAARLWVIDAPPEQAMEAARQQPVYSARLQDVEAAVQSGSQATGGGYPDFFLLTDADIEHSGAELRKLVALAQAERVDLASLMVKLYCRSFAERMLIPAFVFFFFLLYPPKWIRSAKRKVAGAAGGCILVRPEALERAGGIEAVRREVIDDCALAQAVKKSGGRVWLGLTGETRSIRPYDSFAEIGRMISRSAFNQLRHSALLLAFSLFGMLLVYVAPVVLVASGALLPAALGASAWLVMSACYLPMVRYYGLSAVWAFTLPATAVFYMGATFHSAMKYWLGKGGEWKGRVQDPSLRD